MVGLLPTPTGFLLHRTLFIAMRAYIEIFREGTWTSANGTTGTYTVKDLERIRDAFNNDPKAEAMAIVDREDGHVEENSPAYGWVEELYVDTNEDNTNSLYALFRNLDPEFVKWLRERKYKNRSIALLPDEDGKDTYLQHVAFLGAAHPAVSGMSDDGLPEPLHYAKFSNPKARRVFNTSTSQPNSKREFVMNEELRKQLEELVKSLQEILAADNPEGGANPDNAGDAGGGEGSGGDGGSGNGDSGFSALQKQLTEIAASLVKGGTEKGTTGTEGGNNGNSSFSSQKEDEKDRRIAELERDNRRNKFRAHILEDRELSSRITPRDLDGVIDRLMKLDNGKEFSSGKGTNKDVESYLEELKLRPVFTKGAEFAKGGKDTTDFAKSRKERADRIAGRTSTKKKEA